MDIVGVRIPKKKGAKRSAAATIRYPDKADPNDPTEKILYASKHINVKNSERMIAHVEAAVKVSRSPDVVEHLVYSFAQHLKPSEEDCAKVVENVMRLTGCKDCPTKWTVHQNTYNIHIHIVIARAHKDDPSKIIKPSRFIDKVNKAAAKSIHDLGLETSQNSPFVYDGKRFIRGEKNEDEVTVSKKAQSFEVRTGHVSVERDAKTLLLPLVKQVKANPDDWSWEKLHQEAFALGYKIEGAKGGLVFIDRETDEGIKASSIGRFSRKNAEVLLGAFVPGQDRYELPKAHREPKTDYQKFQAAKDDFYGYRAKQLDEVRIKFDSDLVALKKSHQENLRWLKATDKSLIDLAFAEADFREKRAVILAQKAEANRLIREKKFSSWVEYKQQHGLIDPDFNPIEPKQISLAEIYSEADSVKIERKDFRHFKSRALPSGTEYSSSSDDPAFVDVGQKIVIHASQDDDALLASLQLASVKWPSGFKLNGSEQFKKRCIEIAFDEGIAHKITNPETESVIKQIQAERKTALAKQRAQEAAERTAQTAKQMRPAVPPLDRGLPNEWKQNKRDFFKPVPNAGKLSVPSMHSRDNHDPSKLQQAQRQNEYRRQSVLRDYAQRHREPTDHVLKPAEADRLTQSEKLELIAQTLGVDRFRVSSEKVWFDEEGQKQSEWMHFGDREKNGQFKPLSLEKISRRLPDFKQKWQDRLGHSFALEAVSDTHSHITVSGLAYKDIERMSADGFRPALVIESEPRKFQVVLSLPRQTQDERENQRIERELRDYLQSKYGSGEPERLAFAGFENHRHRTPNGTFQTRLYRAEKRECPALLDLARSLKNPEKTKNQPLSYPSDTSDEPPEADLKGQKSTDLAYSYFLSDLTALGWSMSEVDQEAATRLLAIGFAPEQIKSAIESTRSNQQTTVSYDWSLYANRTLDRVQQTQSERIDSLAFSHMQKWKSELGLDSAKQTQTRLNKTEPDMSKSEAPKT